MKKALVLPALLALSLIFAWCENQQISNEQYCNNNWWVLETRYEWWEEYSVCSFDDQSFCYIEDLLNHACNRGEIFYENEWNDEENNNEENNNEENNNEEWYVTDTHKEMSFEEIENTLLACDELWEDLVCGADGGTYFNRCYLEFAWIPEQPNAKIVDSVCVLE